MRLTAGAKGSGPRPTRPRQGRESPATSARSGPTQTHPMADEGETLGGQSGRDPPLHAGLATTGGLARTPRCRDDRQTGHSAPFPMSFAIRSWPGRLWTAALHGHWRRRRKMCAVARSPLILDGARLAQSAVLSELYRSLSGCPDSSRIRAPASPARGTERKKSRWWMATRRSGMANAPRIFAAGGSPLNHRWRQQPTNTTTTFRATAPVNRRCPGRP